MGRRKRGEEPQMRFHSHSGQARVRVNGKVIYLGPWDSPEAKGRYHRIVAEWHATGTASVPTSPAPRSRRAPPPAQPATLQEVVAVTTSPPAGLTIAEVCVLWIAHCEKKFTKPDGTKSSSIHECNMIVRALEPDASMPAASFKARALVTLQHRLVAAGRPRVTVNRVVKGVRRLFRWATQMEYVPESIMPALESVEPLRRGQTEATELPPVTDVPEQYVEAALVKMQRIPADLVRFIRLVGCRPGEAVTIRPCDVDTRGAIWKWTPPQHKNAWRGHDRAVLIGPKAQAILRPYLRRASHRYCFSPAESEQQRCRHRRHSRQSPMTPSQAARAPKANPIIKPGDHYRTSSLRCAIQRAARRAGVPEWATMQLRHNAATEARESMGLDAAQARLGHRTARITEVYAEVSQKKAAEVASRLG
jgi:integrase